MQASALDVIRGPALFVVTLLILVVAGEVGFRAARRFGTRRHVSQTSVVTGALLGTVGLLAAFSLQIVEGRFAERKMLILEDANTISTAYRRANLLPEPHAEQARAILRDYIAVKLQAAHRQEMPGAIAEANRDQKAVTKVARAAVREDPHSLPAVKFEEAIDVMMDTHQERITVSFFHRLPPPMLVALYVIAAMCLLLHGYSAGLTRMRVPIAAFGLIVSLSTLLFLIVELDRPWQSIFSISQEPMTATQRSMKP